MPAYDQKELEQWKDGLLAKKSGSNKKILVFIGIVVVVAISYLLLFHNK
ncbi:MAG: hypothetical protein P8N58_06830 [Emcibacteraceae bacterium]|nr:hypothetical protein [Emcibacteraceae bacterium]|tara:strand:- start:3685 stop:3831 length:147 start_codon:yes stop_codon:yes gene_type:complete